MISGWTKYRKFYIESMSIEEREVIFPETLEEGYDWEVGALVDFMRMNIPEKEENG